MLDWQSFLKLDNAATIDLLSSYASALAAESLLSERSVDQLKVSLASVTPLLSTTQTSVLAHLAEFDTEFLQIMSARYGQNGFAWNHMRSSTRNLLAESCNNLAAWADCALKKAELFMNRPYIANSTAGQSRRELFPTVLLHTAKTLHDAAKDLREVIIDLSVMRPADLLDTTGSQFEQEQRIAILVGFNGLETEAISYCRTELRCLRRVVNVFDELAASLPNLVAGLTENTANNHNSKKLEADCEIFAAECQRLSGTRFEVSSNINVLETRRLGFLFELFTINQRMLKLTKLFTESFAPKDKPTTLELLTDDFERAISCHLIQRGTGARQATQAARDLMVYCRHHQTTPATLIPAELKKINQDLHEDTLAFAATLASEEMTATPGGSAGKSRFFEAAKRIRKSLNVAAPFSVTMGMLLCIFLNAGCGVKTQIVSDALDPRPEIPFHQNDRAPSRSQSNTPFKPNQVSP
jgi:hypothetical protein